jgi:hypothetical protein
MSFLDQIARHCVYRSRCPIAPLISVAARIALLSSLSVVGVSAQATSASAAKDADPQSWVRESWTVKDGLPVNSINRTTGACGSPLRTRGSSASAATDARPGSPSIPRLMRTTSRTCSRMRPARFGSSDCAASGTRAIHPSLCCRIQQQVFWPVPYARALSFSRASLVPRCRFTSGHSLTRMLNITLSCTVPSRLA